MTENMENADEIQQQIEELKNKLKNVKKIEKAEAKQEKQIEKEKEKLEEKEKKKREKKPRVDKKEYMRNYMRQYKQKNMVQEQNRRNTGYYMKKFNIPQEFKDEFGVNTCKVWKAIEAMKHIKTEHADIYPKLFQYI